MKKYTVRLAADERNALQELVRNGKGGAKKLAHARILLKADQADGGPAWTDARIATRPCLNPKRRPRLVVSHS